MDKRTERESLRKHAALTLRTRFGGDAQAMGVALLRYVVERVGVDVAANALDIAPSVIDAARAGRHPIDIAGILAGGAEEPS